MDFPYRVRVIGPLARRVTNRAGKVVGSRPDSALLGRLGTVTARDESGALVVTLDGSADRPRRFDPADVEIL